MYFPDTVYWVNADEIPCTLTTVFLSSRACSNLDVALLLLRFHTPNLTKIRFANAQALSSSFAQVNADEIPCTLTEAIFLFCACKNNGALLPLQYPQAQPETIYMRYVLGMDAVESMFPV